MIIKIQLTHNLVMSLIAAIKQQGSTKEPLPVNLVGKLSRKKTGRRVSAIKGLATSINDRNRKKQKAEGKKDNALHMFGCYVTDTLTALEPKNETFGSTSHK